MATVTIEGSRVTPSTFLAPGKRVTVEFDARVAKMIRRGYVDIVVEEETPAEQIARNAAAVRAPAVLERKITMPPKRSATKAEWVKFLEDNSVFFPPNPTKNDLIARWEAAFGAHAVPDEFVSDGNE